MGQVNARGSSLWGAVLRISIAKHYRPFARNRRNFRLANVVETCFTFLNAWWWIRLNNGTLSEHPRAHKDIEHRAWTRLETHNGNILIFRKHWLWHCPLLYLVVLHRFLREISVEMLPALRQLLDRAFEPATEPTANIHKKGQSKRQIEFVRHEILRRAFANKGPVPPQQVKENTKHDLMWHDRTRKGTELIDKSYLGPYPMRKSKASKGRKHTSKNSGLTLQPQEYQKHKQQRKPHR